MIRPILPELLAPLLDGLVVVLAGAGLGVVVAAYFWSSP